MCRDAAGEVLVDARSAGTRPVAEVLWGAPLPAHSLEHTSGDVGALAPRIYKHSAAADAAPSFAQRYFIPITCATN